MNILTICLLSVDVRRLWWEGCWINSFQPIVVFHIETSHLIFCIGFYMRYNTGLKWVKERLPYTLLLDPGYLRNLGIRKITSHGRM